MRRIGPALRVTVIITGLVTIACRRDPNKADLSKDEVKRLLEDYEAARKKEAERQNATRSPEAASGTPGAASIVAAPAPPAATEQDIGEPLEPTPKEPVAVVRPTAAIEPEGPWIADAATPIAPAGPITAKPDGVFLYAKDDGLHVARLGRLPSGARPSDTPITPIPKSAGTFPLGRGAALTERFAYWVSRGRLVRRALPKAGSAAGPLEILATGARDETWVSTPATPELDAPSIPETAAYIVQAKEPEGPLRAKLWVEGGGSHVLTPEGTTTHSVALAPQKDGVLVVSMHARMAMTPIHARRIRFEAGRPHLGEDVVAWVGGGVQPLTELSVLAGPGDELRAFVPHERSITEFGIAELDIGQNPDMDTPTRWIFYPNGIDPAPLDAGIVCGEPVALYAQPRRKEPDAPQQLVLRSLREPSRAQEIARATAFYSVSMSGVAGGALLAWVADWVSWARTVRCPRR